MGLNGHLSIRDCTMFIVAYHHQFPLTSLKPHARSHPQSNPCSPPDSFSKVFIRQKKSICLIIQFVITPGANRNFSGLGNIPQMYLHEKKMAAPMIIISLKPQTHNTLCALFVNIKDISFFCKITMPSDFIDWSTTRLTCHHIKNLHIR